MARKTKIDELKEYLENYYMTHIEELDELSDLMDLTHIDMCDDNILFNKIIFSLMGFALTIRSKTIIYESLNSNFNKHFNKKEYEECRQVLVDIYKNVYVDVTVKWKYAPTKLSRQLLIAARNTVGDLIYATLAAFRSDGYHLTDLTTPYMTFVPIIQDIDDYRLRCDYADMYPITCLLNDKSITITYDYGENYEFSVNFRKPVYLKNEVDNVIVQKAKGYGICEDNIITLSTYIDEGDVHKVRLPFDFEDPELEDLKENIEADFLFIRGNYYGMFEDLEEDDSLDIEGIM